MLAASIISAALIIFALPSGVPAFAGQVAAGLAIGLLVAAGCLPPAISAPTISIRRRDLAHLHRADRGRAAICHAVDGSTLNFGIVTVFGVFAGSLATALLTGALSSRVISRRATCCVRVQALR
jgi:hypothetical protein